MNIEKVKKFNSIVHVDSTGLVEAIKTEIRKYSVSPILEFNSDPIGEQEILERIGDADCILVSWRTPITANIIKQCPNLKYIGMCCSLIDENSANVHISTARNQGIEVKGVRDYGDEGVIEYIFSEVISLAKGLKGQLWKENAVEITGRTIGIIGMGATGIMLAKAAQAFRMKVLYYSRTRKFELEDENIEYKDLHQLLNESEIISTHLPRNTKVLDGRKFEIMGNNKILINTSLGLTFDFDAFENWMEAGNNYAIFDGDNSSILEGKIRHSNIISTSIVSGWTEEARGRLSKKVLENLTSYLQA